MYIIKWRLHDSDVVHSSEKSFDEKRASELVAIANKEFERAFHWKEAAPA